MKKLILITLIILLITLPVWANAGPPAQDPENNIIYFNDDSGVSLVEEWITYTIDEEWDRMATVEVKYILKNIDNDDERLKLMFLGPGLGTENTEIYADGQLIEDMKLVDAEGIPYNWQFLGNLEIYEPISGELLNEGSTGFGYQNRQDKGFEFYIDIPKGETIELDIIYESDGGYYSFNKLVNDVSSQIYYLSPADFWEGQAKVNMSLVFPDKNYKIHSNIELEKVNDFEYKTNLDKIPDKEWYFSYVNKDGLIFRTNFLKNHNIIAGIIIALTVILGLFLKRKNKWLGIVVLLLIIPELFLFRPTYGFMFMLYIFGPIIVIVGLIIFGIRLFMKKRTI